MQRSGIHRLLDNILISQISEHFRSDPVLSRRMKALEVAVRRSFFDYNLLYQHDVSVALDHGQLGQLKQDLSPRSVGVRSNTSR